MFSIDVYWDWNKFKKKERKSYTTPLCFKTQFSDFIKRETLIKNEYFLLIIVKLGLMCGFIWFNLENFVGEDIINCFLLMQFIVVRCAINNLE